MTNLRNLVFGDDGSAAADQAFLWIASHDWPGWNLEIVHAIAPPLCPPVPAAEAELHPWSPPHPRSIEASFGHVEHLTGTIDPRLALLRPADLVAIGPRGTGLLKSLHLGSTAEWLLAQPAAPIAIVRRPSPVRRALIAHDGSDDADAVTRALAAMPWIREVEITVVTASDGRADADAAAARAIEILAAAGSTPSTLSTSGAPTESLVDVITASDPDLVAVGTRGLSRWPSRGLGSTANAIVRSSECTVLVARADQS